MPTQTEHRVLPRIWAEGSCFNKVCSSLTSPNSIRG